MTRTGSRENIRDERIRLRRLERDLERAKGAAAGLERFIVGLGAAGEPGAFIKLLLWTLSGRLGICRAACFRRSAGRGRFELQYSFGVPRGRVRNYFEADSGFMRLLDQGAFPAALEDCRLEEPQTDTGTGAISAMLEGGGLRYLCAAADESGPRGVLLLGPKISGSGFTPAEIDLLRSMTRCLAAVLRADTTGRACAAGGMWDFILRAARELNTPLAVLKSGLWSLEAGAGGDALLLDLAKDAALRLQDRVEQIVALCEMDAGDRALNLQRTELMQVLEDVARGMIPEFEESEITVGIDDRSGGRQGLLDRPLIRTVLLGMLEKALAAAGRGGRIEIDLGVEEDGPWLVLLMSCQRGCAAPAERQRHGDATPLSAADGGLEVARMIVSGHGGRLDCGAGEKGEARFTLRLPL